MLAPALKPYRYLWPYVDLAAQKDWKPWEGSTLHRLRELPERREDLALDSRWPSFFPAPICLVTTSANGQDAIEKVVGPVIVNRFPYVMALSFCKEALSSRHYVRGTFMEALERSGTAAVQFLVPGPDLDRAMSAIATIPENEPQRRLQACGGAMRRCETNPAPVLDAAYMVYEGRLVRPMKDFEGVSIHAQPWADVGSHRVFFFEITAVQLRKDLTAGERQIRWRSLPAWTPQQPAGYVPQASEADTPAVKYRKPFTPNYRFPSAGTIAFEPDSTAGNMAVKHLPPLPKDQVEIDNDRARWPCFFPSSLGMVSTWAPDGKPNLMPCGSTSILSRYPLVIAVAVSYSQINERYARRASLEFIRKRRRFGYGVPYIHEALVAGVSYAGSQSFLTDPAKVRNAGFEVLDNEAAPVLTACPVHYDCEVIDEIRLGTHVLILGEVKRVLARTDVSVANPLEWCPWSAIEETSSPS